MARATARTHLPLDTWARILGIDPRHFNQVTIPDIKPVNTCDDVWVQHPWQNISQVSREDVGIAVRQAETDLERFLGYRLLPTWEVDERQMFLNPGAPEVNNIGFLDARGFPLSIQGEWGHFISGGIQLKTLITAGAVVTYTDEDSDGYFETATVTVVTTVTNPDDIRVYYPGQAGRDEWEIRPLDDPRTHRRSVTIAGGSATIVFAREQAVDQDLLEAIDAGRVDGTDVASFLAAVDVFAVTNDPQQQATIMWNPQPNFCDCSSGQCPTCAHSTQTACLVAKDYRISRAQVSPAIWDATDEEFDSATLAVGRSPNLIRLWYYAGWRDNTLDAPNLEIDAELARAITYFSLQFLLRPFCGCENVTRIAEVMAQDLAFELATEAKTTSFQLTDEMIGNPFGTSRGAMMAWQLANRQEGGKAKIGRAVRL